MKEKRPKGEDVATRITMAIFETAIACRRENNALRTILRKQGLSDAMIQNRVRRILKKGEDDPTAAQLLKRVCEESLRQLQEFALGEWLEKVELKGKKQ